MSLTSCPFVLYRDEGQEEEGGSLYRGEEEEEEDTPYPLLLVEWDMDGGGTEGGKEGRLEGSLTIRVVTSVRTELHYVTGTGHRPRSWMEPFPLLDGTPPGKAELIVLIVAPESEASGPRKAEQNYQQFNLPNPFHFPSVCLCVGADI